MSYVRISMCRCGGISAAPNLSSINRYSLSPLPVFLPSSSNFNPQFLLSKSIVMTDHFGGVIPSDDDGHLQTKAIYGAVITVTILATIAVIFRFVARRKSDAAISYDDYSILLALVNIPSLTYAYDVENTSLITSSDLCLWPQYKHNPCSGALGPGTTFLHAVTRSTLILSKSKYHTYSPRPHLTLTRFIPRTA